uniref:TSA: Wollemia nobilis Ref_Wollemi_Transcript_6185_1785 transcribed RNA sequence n=1 Tax=Wollemia nobilis TaxID=56998 RepID=A0A0C9RXD3_9CONI
MELIPNLPEEIGRECLLRVSYKAHSKLKAVCRNWESMVSSPGFYHDRKISGTSEQCIGLIQAFVQGKSMKDKGHRAPSYGLSVYDPIQGAWDRLPSIPLFPSGVPLFCHCVSVNQKLVLIGGWHPSKWEAMRSVFVYDFSFGSWRQGADMPTLRSFFACSVSPDGRVCVAGGHDDCKNALRASEAYNVEEDQWEILPPMSQERDECQGVYLDAKFYVISGYTTESQGRFERSAEVFDPSTGSWSRLENMWSVGGCPRACVVCRGNLYFFQKQGVMQYNSKENIWGVVDSVPDSVSVAMCATVWRNKIFVSGTVCNGGDQASYMFDPNIKEEESSRRWIAVNRPQYFSGFVQSAVTVEI